MQPPAEREILEVGRRLLTSADSSVRSPVRALDERAIERASQDADLRTALLRFVDVAPACRSPADLAAHLIGLLGELHERPLPLDAAMRMGSSKAARTALGRAAAAGVRHVAHRFIVAERPGDAEKVLRSLWGEGVTTSVDLLGEATLSSSEADRYAQRCLDTLDSLARIYAALPPMRVLEADSIGPIPRANLSIKVSALTPLLRPEARRRRQLDDAAQGGGDCRMAVGVQRHRARRRLAGARKFDEPRALLRPEGRRRRGGAGELVGVVGHYLRFGRSLARQFTDSHRYVNGSMSYSAFASQWQSLLTSAAQQWATQNHVDLNKY